MKKIFCLLFLILMFTPLFAQRPLAKDILATNTTGTKVIISWILPEETDKPITSIKIYRANKQISSYKQLTKSNLLTEVNANTNQYVDSLNDFKDYYYAVILVTDVPYEFVLPSINSTINSVHLTPVAKKEKLKNQILNNNDKATRDTPLPYLSLLENMETSSQISKESIEKATLLTSKLEDDTAKIENPYVFEEDLVAPEKGDDYLLFEILKNTFIQKKYDEAIVELQKLTKTRIDKKVQERAIFYIGESFYFTGKFDSAVMEFIQVEKNYPLLCKKWINASLDNMKLNK